jgi:hypothetical protein
MIDDASWNRAAYHRRKGKPLGPEPTLPDEMTPQGIAMEAELERRRMAAQKEAIRKSRLKRHKLYAVKLQGGEVKP